MNLGNIRIDFKQLLEIAFRFVVMPCSQRLLSRLGVLLQGFVLRSLLLPSLRQNSELWHDQTEQDNGLDSEHHAGKCIAAEKAGATVCYAKAFSQMV